MRKIVMVFLVAIMPSMAFAVPIQLPQTGQSRCFDSAGLLQIPCYNTGQDGELRAGALWPSVRFADNGDGTMTDNLTGLAWTKDANAPGPDACASGSGKTWEDALAHISCLNSNAYLGYTDWRLPNIVELGSLTNYDDSRNDTWLNDSGFSHVQPWWYWSSTSDAYYPYLAWAVAWTTSGIGSIEKQLASAVAWPVRTPATGYPGVVQLPATGQTTCYNWAGGEIPCTGTGQDGDLKSGAVWPVPRVTDNGNGTMTDNLIGLVWTKDAYTPGPYACIPGPAAKYFPWEGAPDYIACLNENNYLGFNDWRIPNVNELRSLIDYGHSSGWLGVVFSPEFLNADENTFWSGTSGPSNEQYTGYVYAVSFFAGGSGYLAKKPVYGHRNPVWPVRGGQVNKPAISVWPISLAFGNITTGSSSPPQAISLTNHGAGEVQVTASTVLGANSTMFSLDGGNCGSITPTLAPGASCSISVTFTPQLPGEKKASLRLDTTDPVSPRLDVVLSGTGTIIPFLINGGSRYTSSSKVLISTSPFLATDTTMEFKVGWGTWTQPELVKPSKYLALPPGDGLKTVYAMFSDPQVSPLTASATIVLDTTVPTGTITINRGAAATSDTTVVLSLTAADVNGVTEMQFSTDKSTWGPWESFAAVKSYALPSAALGQKIVYARFKDPAGNISLPVSDSIRLTSATPPASSQGYITINSDAPCTAKLSVSLTLEAPTPACTAMKFSTNGYTWSGWETFRQTRAILLPAGNGMKTVYVRFRDNARNIFGPYSDTIILDTFPPVGTISINSGAYSTNSPDVELSLSASDVNEVTDMQFSTDKTNWSPWEAFNSVKGYSLPSGIGVRTVYVRFRDAAGKVSPLYRDTIMLSQ